MKSPVLLIFTASFLLLASAKGDAPSAEKTERLSKINRVESKLDASEDSRRVEVAFVLDTTGSMGGLIDGAKQKIWSIAREIVAADDQPQVKFALIGYRDRGDEYITKTQDLTDDLDLVYADLMEFQANGGGDAPESVNQALYESVNQLSWSKDPAVDRFIFLVGDAPPHMDYKDDIHFQESCEKATEKGIIINTVQCGNMPGTQEIWESIAAQASGEFVALDQSGGMQRIATPYDEKIADRNRVMVSTVITYGDQKAQSLGRLKMNNAVVAESEAVADRASYLSSVSPSSAPTVISGNEDLVAQIEKEEMQFSDINKAMLPEPMREISDEELGAVIESKVKLRNQTQLELNELIEKRQKFVEKELERRKEAGEVDAFDLKVKEMIQKQRASVASTE